MPSGDVRPVPYEIVEAPDFGLVVLTIEVDGGRREIEFHDGHNWFIPRLDRVIEVRFDGKSEPTHVVIPDKGELRLNA